MTTTTDGARGLAPNAHRETTSKVSINASAGVSRPEMRDRSWAGATITVLTLYGIVVARSRNSERPLELFATPGGPSLDPRCGVLPAALILQLQPATWARLEMFQAERLRDELTSWINAQRAESL